MERKQKKMETNHIEISTKDLVYELKKREGVETKHAEPHKDLNVKVNGPAIVLIVTD